MHNFCKISNNNRNFHTFFEKKLMHAGKRNDRTSPERQKKGGIKNSEETSSELCGAYETRTRDPMRDRHVF